MDRFAIVERDDPQDALGRFAGPDDFAPKTEATAVLRLFLERRAYHGRTPIPFDIRPFAQNLLLEISGRLHAASGLGCNHPTKNVETLKYH